MNDFFRVFSHRASLYVGTPWAFAVALCIIAVWAISGPIFGFSDTWQLVINTGTTIVTFLMVFLIQNTQNRDAKALQLKLDELIRSAGGARNALVALEDMSDENLDQLQAEFEHIRDAYDDPVAHSRLAAVHDERKRRGQRRAKGGNSRENGAAPR
jgi:low affinity Fe/Cu permease